MGLSSIIRLLSCIVHIALGLYVLLKAPKHRLNQIFSLVAFSIGIMEGGYFALMIKPEWRLGLPLGLIGQSFMHCNLVLFSLIFGQEDRKFKNSKFYLIPIYLATLAFIINILSGKLKIVFSYVLPKDSDTFSLANIKHALIFGKSGSIFLIFLIICILISLMNMENAYRNFGHIKRRIKYPAIIFMATLSLHLLIYSLAIGFSYISMEVLSVASIALMATSIFMAYPILKPEPVESRIYMSRGVVAKSYTILLAGIYLLIIGMLGKIAQIIGRNLNFFVAFLIVFFIILIVILLILSRSIKHRIQLFIERNFYSRKYDYRQEWENFSRRVFSILSMKELLY